MDTMVLVTLAVGVTVIFFLLSNSSRHRKTNEQNEMMVKEAQKNRQKQVELLEELLLKQNELAEEIKKLKSKV
ncbi:hypothetical protein [Alkalicoccobacillus plakortidis]|uniref:Uncharacterized protein n=1 Tax=Alkalicoccobacillus plakortidis TaxID=444060 RepID=A0ABT0XLD1_9BACI|nr:hypothetical protein [Alkalicoccobacillus plakortidis]MCM2676718.1 hypothetical protein [Alkalicoccobacillus plakortidis]